MIPFLGFHPHHCMTEHTRLKTYNTPQQTCVCCHNIKDTAERTVGSEEVVLYLPLGRIMLHCVHTPALHSFGLSSEHMYHPE